MANRFGEDLRGIKGWLILVAIGVVISPFKIAFGATAAFMPLFQDGIWRVLVTPGTEALHPFWMPLLSLEITYNLAMFGVLIWLNVLFFSKHRWMPRLYITVLLTTLVFLPFDSFLVSLILDGEPVWDDQTVQEFARSAIAAAIWIPYMLKSERVKATFTGGRPAPANAIPIPVENEPDTDLNRR